ncbi:hypothetical protein CQA49_07210 [Helicobacter sp. MIT 00-7814]|uniref:hypothetical protein n=1 Tax=unclassified Helicobacter TaxID=2593540 RepID=UPI000E1F4040|nr:MULTISPECIES: hypothetical protein [unclassified Helicobacter]RDU52698.1 hypothetical protein CQA37_08190 [Helicobacter sp. MIT 99-10781]RDU53132.1 hypothetical protein CQA49_07210 [Helicobacter sp. MIT 00-7814]
MKKLLMIAAFSFVSLQALSYDEMLEQEYIEPSSVDCRNAEETIEVVYLCMSKDAQQGVAIEDNFYSSYYHIVLARLDTQDKKEFEKIGKQMPEDRRIKLGEENNSWNKLRAEEGVVNSADYNEAMLETLEIVYLKYIRKITDFIYDNPKYKYIFDEIFAPNSKEYYELINSDRQFLLLDKIIDKAAKDNLIDKTGKLIQK